MANATKLKQVKKASEMQLSGVDVKPEFRDGQLDSVTLTDSVGAVLKIAMSSYSMNAYIPAPPSTEKKFVLAGSVANVADVRETFDTRWDAEQRQREIADKFREDLELKITEQDVPVGD